MTMRNTIGESCGGGLVFVVLAGFGFLCVSGCVDRAIDAVKQQSEGENAPDIHIAASATPEDGVPDSLSSRSDSDSSDIPQYSIVESNVTPGIKRALDVRLSRKASEDELRQLAIKLKNLDSSEYQRTLIGYFLPGAEASAASGEWATYWARTDFNPSLEIKILGLSIDDDNAIDQADSTIPGELLGRWSDETVGMPAHYTLFRNGGKTYIKTTFKDVSSRIFEVVEKPASVGKRYEEIGSLPGEYYLIDASGTLKQGDEKGIFLTMQPVIGQLSRKIGVGSSSGPKHSINASTHELVVLLSVQAKIQDDKRIVVAGKTNLPADTELMISVEDAVSANGACQTKSSVLSDGTYQSEPLGQLSGLEDGWYIASVTMPIAMTQPEHVRRTIGATGDILSGPLVKRVGTFGATVSAEAKFVVGDDNAATIQAVRLKKELDEYKHFAAQIEDLFARLETIKNERMVEDTSTFSNAQIGTTSRDFWDAIDAALDRVDDSIGMTPAGFYLKEPLADIMTMWMNVKDETKYGEARLQYIENFKVLEESIRERESKLINVERTKDTSAEDAKFRTWTSASGKFSIEAAIVSSANGVVTLKNRQGKQITVDLKKLSDADRVFIANWQSAKH